jgi:cyclopropane fatty-acyl-phospholipid synthase-like methyltransferase
MSIDIINYLVLGIIIAVFALALHIAIASWFFAPWVPARKRDMDRIFKLAELKNGQIFYDLGCGSGRLVEEAAKRGAKAIGLELNPALFFLCQIRKMFSKYRSNMKFKLINLYHEDLSAADAIYLFGMPTTVARIKEKMQKELKSGARVVSYSFTIPGWQMIETSKPTKKDLPVHLYTIK